MSKYRVDSIANLARQLAFTPAEPRAAQVLAAEKLLHDLDAAKGYPLEFVIFRVTGYRPKSTAHPDGTADLLTGIALQHDLGLLIEQVSDTLSLRATDTAEPVLAIDDVTARFGVTSKTVQRWRRRGLPARRFWFADGKRRVGFLLSSVERFISVGRASVVAPAVPCDRDEVGRIVEHARRLAVGGRCTAAELARRVGRRVGRSPMAVLHTIRKHDAEQPGRAVLEQAGPPVDDATRAAVCTAAEAGATVAELARRFGRSRSTVYAVLVQNRAERLADRRVRYVDDPLYHDDDAAAVLTALAAGGDLPPEPTADQSRVPRDLPPYLRDLYRTPLLSPPRERGLFLLFNYHKFRFATARRRLDPELASGRDLARLQRHLADATAVKNDILRANLRLVVSIARRHVRPGVPLMDLVSEGNLTLMRAVEGFDVHKGFRFSTYATLALMKGFARAVPLMAGAGRRTVADADRLAAVADARGPATAERHLARDHVAHLLARLDDRGREVLRARYGLGDAPASCEQVGRRMGAQRAAGPADRADGVGDAAGGRAGLAGSADSPGGRGCGVAGAPGAFRRGSH